MIVGYLDRSSVVAARLINRLSISVAINSVGACKNESEEKDKRVEVKTKAISNNKGGYYPPFLLLTS